MFIDEVRCVGCGACIPVCPEDAITMRNGKAIIEASLCNGCGDCQDACPEGVIHPVEMIETNLIPTADPTSRVTQPRGTKITPVSSRILPAIGTFLVWTGREVIPRLATYALDVLDNQIQNRDPDRSSKPSRNPERAYRRQTGRRRRLRRYRNRMKQNRNK